MNKLVAGIIVAAVVVVGAVFLLSRNGDDTGMVSPTATPETAGQATSTPDGDGKGDTEGGAVKEFTVVGTPFAFSIKEMKVMEGDTVKVTFVNQQGFHDWVLDEFEGARTKQLPAGQQETIEFVADKKGTFEYYCSVGNHRQQGMVGKLIVE